MERPQGKSIINRNRNKFIIQYDNWPGYSSGTGPFTWQFVIHKNGKMMLYYKTITGTSTSATVGIENSQWNRWSAGCLQCSLSAK